MTTVVTLPSVHTVLIIVMMKAGYLHHSNNPKTVLNGCETVIMQPGNTVT